MKIFTSFDTKNRTYNVVDEDGKCLYYSHHAHEVEDWLSEKCVQIGELLWEMKQ
ncbi:MAG: hypothetical protein GY861_04690 [bacterium]|nr:hypothetical protein [bacterium]